MGGKTALIRPWGGLPAEGPLLARGYVVTYRPGQAHACPGCGGEQWHVGRQTAECACCLTALPLADPGSRLAGDNVRPARRFAFA
jgi:hypothetical protein